MIDETSQGPDAAGGERVSFCQDCGRPLSRETMRAVGSGVFCEPCLEARLASSAAQGSAVPPPAGGTLPPPIPATSGEPRPLLAWFLGLIPGVGAMYNGQFAKGIVHFIIFAVLASLADSADIFGFFVAGWIFYQAFEAYHTAKARLDGTPLPNAFGFNDIGDRMGFGKSWPGSVSRPATTPVTGWTPGQPPAAPGNWAGYVPPTQFGHDAAHQAAAAEQARQQAYSDTGFGAPSSPAAAPQQASASWGSTPHMPYAAAYTPVEAGAADAPAVPTRRFPAAAIWLIVLGVVFLLANSHLLHINGRWMLPLILAGLSLWAFVRRLGWLGGVNRLTGNDPGIAQFICILRGPVMLMVLAILFVLQAAYVATLGQTWPVLVIALGGLLLLERSVGRPAYIAPAAPAGFVADTPQPAGYAVPVAETPASSWPVADDSAKGGQ